MIVFEIYFVWRRKALRLYEGNLPEPIAVNKTYF